MLFAFPRVGVLFVGGGLKSTMTVPLASGVLPQSWSVADLQHHLGVPPERIRLFPSPGLATERDLIRLLHEKVALCELVDGVLVEKVMGREESALAMVIGQRILSYLDERPLGTVLGADGPVRTWPRQVGMPDVCFIRQERMSTGEAAKGPVLPVAPVLAVEVLSVSNTPVEMRRKLEEYFAAGTRLVWYIDPQTRSAKSYTSAAEWVELGLDDSLEGGEALPGLTIPLQALFERALGR